MGHPGVTGLGGPNPIEFQYDLSWRRKQVDYPNGMRTKFSYSPGKYNHLREITHGSEATRASSFTYSYDLNDYVTDLETTRNGITVNSSLSYVYDHAGQLTSATKAQGTGNEMFTYDAMGNRLREGCRDYRLNL